MSTGPDWLAHAFDIAWDWTYDRRDDQDNRVRAFCYAHHIPFCPGMGCPCANERATPVRRLLIRRLRPLPRARVICDVQDRDYRWRFWNWTHYRLSNLSIRLRANDWPRNEVNA